MKAKLHNGNFDDYRDGFGAFNVLDFGTGMVFDIITNGTNSWVIYEKLFIPGVTAPEESFTKVIPINYQIPADEALKCLLIYDSTDDKAEYYIGDQLVYKAQEIPAKIKSLQTGFGIITLHPIENGKSVSCKGQGMDGTWSDFKYYAA